MSIAFLVEQNIKLHSNIHFALSVLILLTKQLMLNRSDWLSNEPDSFHCSKRIRRRWLEERHCSTSGETFCKSCSSSSDHRRMLGRAKLEKYLRIWRSRCRTEAGTRNQTRPACWTTGSTLIRGSPQLRTNSTGLKFLFFNYGLQEEIM